MAQVWPGFGGARGRHHWIDRNFVEDLPDGSFDLAIVKAVLGWTRRLDSEVVAEGVEREEQERTLHEPGVFRVQGWLYAAAMAQQPALLRILARD